MNNNTTETVRFMKHYVTNGAQKARVHYSAFAMVSTGQPCVTLYAKKYKDEEALTAIFANRVEDNTDLQTDYFEKARVRIVQGDPLYAAALARAQGGR
jgi:hypothetical protein